MVHHYKVECPVKNWIALYKVKVTVMVLNVSECLSGQYLQNHLTFFNQTCLHLGLFSTSQSSLKYILNRLERLLEPTYH